MDNQKMVKKRGFPTNKTNRNRATINLFLICIVLLMAVSMVSALEWDNVKGDLRIDETTSKYGRIEIRNSVLGFEWWQLGKVAELELKKNTDTCGISCSAETEIVMYQKGALIDNVRFMTLQEDESWSEQPIRSYEFYIKTGESKEIIDDYEYQCVDGKYNILNDSYTQICNNIKIGSHEEITPIYEEYNLGEEVEAGTYYIKLEGEKKPSRTVDWQITSQGKLINEWAVWEGSEILFSDNFDDGNCDGWNPGYNYDCSGGIMELTAYQTVWIPATAFNSTRNLNWSFDAYVPTGGSMGINLIGSAIGNDDWNQGINMVGYDSTPKLRNGPTTSFMELSLEPSFTKGRWYNHTIEHKDNVWKWYVNGTLKNSTIYDTSGVDFNYFEFQIGGALGLTGFKVDNIIISSIGTGINLNSPANNYLSPTNNVQFNATATASDGATLTNMSLWHNGTGTWHRNQTFPTDSIGTTSGTYNINTDMGQHNTRSGYQGIVLTMKEGNYLINVTRGSGGTTPTGAYVCAGSDGNCGTVLGSTTFVGSVATFNPPVLMQEGVTYSVVVPTSSTDIFYGSAVGDSAVYTDDNAIVDGVVGASGNRYGFHSLTFKPQTSLNASLTLYLTQPTLWTFEACDGDGDCGFATENRTVSVDATAPSITINEPTTTENIGYYNQNQTLNWTITDTNLDSCWFTYNMTNTSLTCGDNNYSFTLEDGVYNITMWANDSVGNVNSSFIEWNYTILVLAESHSDPVPEGSEQTFYINVTSGQASTTPSLVYDRTSYLGTCTSSGFDFYCERDLDIPPVSADINVTFYWSFLMGDTSVINGSDTNLTVTNFAMDNCSVNTVEIMNLLLKEEEGNTLWTGNGSNVEIEVDIYSLDNVLIGEYNKQWTNESDVSICVGNLTGANYNLYTTIGFDIDNYVNEFWFIDKKQINTTVVPINISLMDLLATDSTSFLFNYFDEDGLAVSDPIIHVWRKYIGEGLFREVERSKQNDDGNTIVHLVEEDVIYYFQVSQNNTVIFTSDTYTALCDTTPCTVTLEASGGYQDFDSDWDLVDNGAYSISSSAITRTVNLTFTTSTPSTFNLTVYKLDSEGEYEFVGSDQTTGTSGTLDVVVPAINGNVSFFSVVRQDGDYKASYWNDFTAPSREYFGSGFAVFLGLLIIMCLGFMAISEGSGTVVFVILGMFLTVILGLIDYGTSGVGIGLMIYFIVTGGIIIWKLTRRNR